MQSRKDLPDYVKKYFWGDDLSELDWQKHEDYVAKTLLERGDIREVKWLLSRLGKRELKRRLKGYGLSKKSESFWRLVW